MNELSEMQPKIEYTVSMGACATTLWMQCITTKCICSDNMCPRYFSRNAAVIWRTSWVYCRNNAL